MLELEKSGAPRPRRPHSASFAPLRMYAPGNRAASLSEAIATVTVPVAKVNQIAEDSPSCSCLQVGKVIQAGGLFHIFVTDVATVGGEVRLKN